MKAIYNNTAAILQYQYTILSTGAQATSHLLLQGGANAPSWLRQGGAFSIQGGAL